jgi:response regulator RpfG family c-di-GMP phosphodiesterase
MNRRVLIVDDDPVVLGVYERALRGLAEVTLAENPRAAFSALFGGGEEFAVVVSDMHMPMLNGLQLLIEVGRRCPDTMRIMITSSEDQKTAVDAVNSGRVFRFLPKPCRPDVLKAAVVAALEQFHKVKTERELFEQTFNGVVQVLTGVVSAVQPESLGQWQNLRERARLLGKALEMTDTWEIETAAMLLRVGITTIPRPVLAKIRTGDKLSDLESDLLHRIPEIGARMLENIPRLRPVAQMIQYQSRGYDGSGWPEEGPSGKDIPLGARILRALVDLRGWEDSGLTTEKAVMKLREDPRAYDPDVIHKLDVFVEDPDAHKLVEVEERYVEDLIPGMVLATDVLSDEKVSLIAKGTALTPVLVERLRNFAELGRVIQPICIRPKSYDAAALEAMLAERRERQAVEAAQAAAAAAEAAAENGGEPVVAPSSGG